MKRLFAAALVLLLGACASTVRIDGEQTIHNQMKVSVTEAWNKVQIPGGEQPYEAWTQEGLRLDELRLWGGVASGTALIKPLPKAAGATTAPRVPTFDKSMGAEQIINLFEQMYGADGSIVTIERVEPAAFVGERGVRVEFSRVRKGDELTFKGVGWFAVRQDRLYAAAYTAPRLHFFGRLSPRAEAVARSARLPG